MSESAVMKAAWYEQTGAAATVLTVGTVDAPHPGPGEVRIQVRVSGINPGDVKKRAGWLSSDMPYPRVIPHSDGAGRIDAVGEGVDRKRIGQRVWCHGAQSYRRFGTAAEFVVVPAAQAVPLPDGVSYETGACLGIPAITAHRAVFGDGSVAGRAVLVAGAAGAVGSAALELAAWGGAHVLALVRRPEDAERARKLGARAAFVRSAHDERGLAEAIRAAAPGGVERIIDVAFDANVWLDASVAASGAVIAACAALGPEPRLPFWPLLFANVTVRLLGSDDFPETAKRAAVADISAALSEGRLVPALGARFALEQVAQAHEAVERGSVRGRVVVEVAQG